MEITKKSDLLTRTINPLLFLEQIDFLYKPRYPLDSDLSTEKSYLLFEHNLEQSIRRIVLNENWMVMVWLILLYTELPRNQPV